MSYSDYGGYCWKNRKRFRKGEDGTLVGITAPRHRPLEKATGLKFDVLINAYEKQGAKYDGSDKENEKVDWLTQHSHHVVVGGLEELAVVGHKQEVIIVWNGKPIGNFPEYIKDKRVVSRVKSNTFRGKKEGYEYWLKSVKESPFERTGGVVFKLLTPKGIEYAGVSGYGIGSHWWKEDNGRQFLYPGERRDSLLGWYWDSDVLEEDKKKHNLTDEQLYEPIGFKPRIHWPTYEEWEEFVFQWANKCK